MSINKFTHIFRGYRLHKLPARLTVREPNQIELEFCKMANSTSLEELNESLTVLRDNSNQMFLIVMGCVIFCEYRGEKQVNRQERF